MNGLQALLAGTQKGLGSLKVVMATGLYKTAAGVVGQQLLKDNGEALRTYLTIHLRSARAAQVALAGIEDAVEHGKKDELEKGPRKRAALFLAARNVVEYERIFGDCAHLPMSSVPWEPTPPGKIEGWGRALDELRFGLGEEEGEILALAHVFQLGLADIAYVLSTPKSEVKRRLDAGFGYAKLLLEDVFGPDVPKLPALLQDAFRVAPATKEEIDAARPKVVALPAGTLIGDRYEIESMIGGGEFAHVYRARDVRVPGHVVALKLLHRVARTQAAREGAIRELSLIASAFHPSLVHFKDHGWFEDRLWFVMPFYQGELLLARLERGPIPVEEALAQFERLARGLAALHAAGIRHQDIKPENIFLVSLATGGDAERPELLPILLDLGVASPNGEMALAGTPMYFPPEVAARIFDEQCDVPLTPKADVFALALSLLHSIEAPDLREFEGCEVEAFLKKRVRFAPSGPNDPALSHLAPRFERWLAADPSERPSAGELADELAHLRAELGPGPRRVGVVPKSLRTLAVGAALASILTLAGTLTDAPARPVRVVRGASAIAPEPTNEGDRMRLLRHRLGVEERRALELEEELGRLRRRELGVEPEERAAAPGEPALTLEDTSG